MLLSLAWKNIWRNKKRSLIIVAAITFGLWGGLFSGAVMVGMMESMVDTAISRDLAHIQIHNPGYDADKDIRNYIAMSSDVLETARSAVGLEAVAGRTLIMGIAASPSSSYGVRIIGVIPGDSKKVTDIYQKIMEGSYFESDRKNQIIIGHKLAERLNLKLRSKVVLSFQDLNGEIAYIACRVVGIFKTNSSLFDEMNVYVLQKDLFRILSTEPIYHELVLRVSSSELLESVKKQLIASFPELMVETWEEIAPELAYISDTTGVYTYIFVAIILFALLFGITNTMLMSVVDRIRELGMLIAIGMKKMRVFTMIVLETVLLSLTGGICGIIISIITIAYYGNAGIDLTAIATSLESFGTSAILYPFLPITMYVILTIMIIIAANIAAILPAWKATHLVPSEAIRTY
jgi:ABC-type lipoprotein release transport system permease subunit